MYIKLLVQLCDLVAPLVLMLGPSSKKNILAGYNLKIKNILVFI